MKGLHMSKALLLSCVLTTGYVAFLIVSLSESQTTESSPQQPAATTPAPLTDIDGFLRSLDPESVNRCLQLHQSGKMIDQETLLQCGDFSLYAKHQRLPKQYAVGHFKNILLNSSTLHSLRAQLQDSSELVMPAFQTR